MKGFDLQAYSAEAPLPDDVLTQKSDPNSSKNRYLSLTKPDNYAEKLHRKC
ncbi:MAG: hypothetical protein R2747_21295 [Pyrinomonadaceae bacterium]